jgi:hypothetical protein
VTPASAAKAATNGSGPLRIALNVTGMRLREVIAFEKQTGVRFMDVLPALEKGEASMEVQLALVWILRRREEPELTFEDVLDMSVDDLASIEYVEEPNNREERRAATKRGDRSPPV